MNNQILHFTKTLLSLENGAAKLKVVAKEIRSLEVEGPSEGINIKRDMPIIRFPME